MKALYNGEMKSTFDGYTGIVYDSWSKKSGKVIPGTFVKRENRISSGEEIWQFKIDYVDERGQTHEISVDELAASKV